MAKKGLNLTTNNLVKSTINIWFVTSTFCVAFKDDIFGAVSLSRFTEMIKTHFNEQKINLFISDKNIKFKSQALLNELTQKQGWKKTKKASKDFNYSCWRIFCFFIGHLFIVSQINYSIFINQGKLLHRSCLYHRGHRRAWDKDLG